MEFPFIKNISDFSIHGCIRHKKQQLFSKNKQLKVCTHP